MISNTPALIPFRLLRLRPFSLLLEMKKSDDSPLDLTDATLRLVISDTERKGGDQKVADTATILDAELGLARFDIQGDDLNMAKGVYDISITITSPELFQTSLVQSELEIVHNADPAVPADYSEVIPPLGLTVTLRDQSRVVVKVNHVPDTVLLGYTTAAAASASAAGISAAEAAASAAASVGSAAEAAEAEAHANAAAASAAAAAASAAAAAASETEAETYNSSAATHAALASNHADDAEAAALAAAGHETDAQTQATNAANSATAAAGSATAAAASAAEAAAFWTDQDQPDSDLDLAVAALIPAASDTQAALATQLEAWVDGDHTMFEPLVRNIPADTLVVRTIKALTQVEYDAIVTPDPETLYVIVG